MFGRRGIANGDFTNPRGIAVEPSTGRIFVSDASNARIQVFRGDDYTFVRTFGKPGREPGAFSGPAGLTFDMEGRVAVVEYGIHPNPF